jgi:hypothetical protein
LLFIPFTTKRWVWPLEILVLYAQLLQQRRISHVCDVEAHGDGILQIPVESMDFCPVTRCLASVGEGKHGIRLWSVDPNGKISGR